MLADMVLTPKDLADSNKILTADLTTLFKTMLDNSINEIKNTIIENLKLSNENLQLRVKELEAEVKSIKEANIQHEKSTEAALQHGRLEQVIISGIPASVDHDKLEEASLNILNDIKSYKCNGRDVAACHRVGKNNDTILRFVNRKDAEDCFVNRGKLKNIAKEAHGLGAGDNIYVRENLSPYMSKLAYFCRVLKRKDVIEKITTYKGVVKIFRTVNYRTVSDIIGHRNDLDKLFPNLDDLLEV